MCNMSRARAGGCLVFLSVPFQSSEMALSIWMDTRFIPVFRGLHSFQLVPDFVHPECETDLGIWTYGVL